jgi:hypothetical protein
MRTILGAAPGAKFCIQITQDATAREHDATDRAPIV